MPKLHKSRQLARIKEVAKAKSKAERLLKYRELRDSWISMAEERAGTLSALELMRAVKMLTEVIEAVEREADESDSAPKALIIPGWAGDL